ncbi:MAG: ferritin family protein [candidate division WOR-3 bacterium]|nr:ferritin family protein [candidate division WOR-3 bacterium]MCX7757018.1 ferritin family protein [candidate division WOR-3 bacterium]MDW7987322.1 ferritin family protein [candidate division WOR-3 bacterium]
MDISKFNLKDLLLTALKAELESKKIYEVTADRVSNFLLKDRLKFLANEENRHYLFFQDLYYQEFGNTEFTLPDKTPVPLPTINISSEDMPISAILTQALEAEKAAFDFYTVLAERYNSKSEIKNMLLYIASMEMGHYRLLEIERENAEKFEAYNIEYPLMHIGP